MHEDAVELLQEAHYALSGASRFRNAVLDGGVFENILSQSHIDGGDYDFEDISTALEYEVKARYDHTDHTRFGAWAKHVRENTRSPQTLASGSERADAFTYGPIEQTTCFSNDPNFPRGFSSTYLGRTVAMDRGVDGPAFYDGEIQVNVSWSSGSPNSSDVTVVIENLFRIDTGDPLLVGQFEVSSLIVSSGRVVLDSDNRIGLAGTSVVRVRYLDPSRAERSSGTVTLDGKFVGYTAAGPGPSLALGTEETSMARFARKCFRNARRSMRCGLGGHHSRRARGRSRNTRRLAVAGSGSSCRLGGRWKAGPPSSSANCARLLRSNRNDETRWHCYWHTVRPNEILFRTVLPWHPIAPAQAWSRGAQLPRLLGRGESPGARTPVEDGETTQ